VDALLNVMGDDTQFMGGSKSGFGGLGLRGTGRMPLDSNAPSLATTPGALGRGNSLEFLGATKAAPAVIVDAIDPRSEAPASEPAVQGATP
jgi:hypothetical protein